MKFCIVPTFTLMPKAINFDEHLVNDSTRPCTKYCEKRWQPGGHLFEISAHPMAHKGTSKRHIRCIKKMACLAHMDAPPSLNAYRKNAVPFSAHPAKRNVETKMTSLRHVQAFVRMHPDSQHVQDT
jgi:hypothetical protein